MSRSLSGLQKKRHPERFCSRTGGRKGPRRSVCRQSTGKTTVKTEVGFGAA